MSLAGRDAAHGEFETGKLDWRQAKEAEAMDGPRRPSEAGNRPRLELRRIGPFFGAEVTGVDLSRPLDATTVAELQQQKII